MRDTNDRLEDIETQLAFQEDALEQFNAVAVSQQGQIDELRAQLRVLQEQFKALPDGSLQSAVDPALEKPPHY
ncbi:MAG: SlyX family protein [Pseudomonadota bacterium]|nr:SlyX family protein [Pseudomonadota bacterium]